MRIDLRGAGGMAGSAANSAGVSADGGAIRKHDPSAEAPLDVKKSRDGDEKVAIGEAAAALVREAGGEKEREGERGHGPILLPSKRDILPERGIPK